MEPTIQKIRLCKPYLVNPSTKEIFSSYEVLVKWPDGKYERFPSEEHAKSKIEGRPLSKDNLVKETPAGYNEAVQNNIKAIPKPVVETTTSDEVNVVITSCNDKKISVIKIIREVIGLGLKEAKDKADNLPYKIKEGISREEAEELVAKLLEAGATVNIE